MYPGRTPQNQGPGGPPMVQYPGVYYKTPSSSPWPPMQTAPASAAPSSSYVQYPSKYTATSSAHSATRSALAESYERIRNEMRGLKSESQPSYQPAPPAPSLKQKNDPLTSLCNNTSVSLSSLLEAAMAPNAGSSNRTTEDPIMKKTILGKCERKIAQLYRDRITGMGSFFPLVEANTTTVADTNYLLRHCPRLEFNSEPIGAPWTCPDVKIELKKPDPPKPTVDLPQTIKTVESIKSLGATLPNTSIPPPGIEPVNVGLSEPSINLITDMTFEKWADVEREKRQHERERQWEQLMMFTGRGRSSQEKEERRRSKRSRRSRSESTGRSRSSSRRRSRSSRRSRSLSRRRSRSKSRRRRSSSSRSRARNRSRKRSRSRRHHSSSFSLSPSPSPRRRGESRRSPASPPPRRRRTPPRDRSRRRSSNDIPAQPVSQPAASWPGPYSSSQSQSGPYGPPVGVPPEYPNAPPGYPVHQPPPSPYIQPGMPLRPYGPRPGYPYPAPGLRPPGVGPWPGSLPGLPYQLPPPRGLCATPNMVPIGQPPAPGTGSFQYSSPEVIVIDDGDNAVPGSPMHPPGLSPEIPTKPDPSDCLRMQCFSHLSRIRKVHEYLYKLQRDCEGLKDIIYDMEADNREFHGVYALIRGFLCKMEINTSKNPGAAFKVVLPTSQTMSMMWAIHHAYHDIKKDELLTLFDDLFNDSPSLNVSSLVSTVFKQCARCVSDARQKYREAHDREETRSRPRDNARANRARERDSPHRHREDSDRSRRRSRDSSRKSRTPDKHSRERTVRSSSRKSGSPRKSSKEPTVRRRSRKSRSPRKHSKEKRARSTSRKSRSPRKRSEGRKDRDESKRSRSREKRSKEEGGQDASTKSTSSRKSSKEKSEEKSTEKSTGESPEGKNAETSRPENGDADCSRPSKDSKSEEGIDKSPKSGVTDGVRAKIDEPPIAAVPKNVQNQPPKGTNTEKPRPDGERTEAKTNADSRSNKAEDFKTRVRQVQSTVELLKKQIDDLEGPNRKTDEPMLLVKAGMLCRRLTINDKAEIKIVVTPEILPDMIRIVHTMAPVHAPAPKTVVVYKKHFTPMDDIDKVVTEVLDNCDTCKRK